ncbi:hypothetical protein FOA52_015160 [Chlamydomonas sp. UWO 241]|nr:hypothetical protein FOA52_015160 [Chlamydomonas sp. UWO 241]
MSDTARDANKGRTAITAAWAEFFGAAIFQLLAASTTAPLAVASTFAAAQCWEFLLCFLFIMVQYAALFVRPGHGDAAPLASGAALFAILSSVGELTGGSPVSPARTIASAFVFNCYWSAAGVYLAGQLAAAALAAFCAVMWHGPGPFYARKETSGSSDDSGLHADAQLVFHCPAFEDEWAPLLPGETGTARARDATFAPSGKV